MNFQKQKEKNSIRRSLSNGRSRTDNAIGVKLLRPFRNFCRMVFGEPITLTTGILTYPITFLLTDGM